jgi:UDP-N-acetylglucosamine--N-acetylmuramyl-(pentapeptide) pyrophosphoryl-undecaprenol N-acetylglucosamine transferase
VSFENEEKKASEATNGIKSYVSAFIYEMDLAYAMADLVVSRAGALSVSEICLAGKPSILVPFPNASEDHQTENAKSLVNNGAARLVLDKNAQADLVSTALKTLSDKTSLNELGLQSLAMGKPYAATEIAQAILNDMNPCA